VRRLLLVVLGSAILISACGSANPTKAPVSPSPTVAPTPTPTPTPVPTPTPTIAPSFAPQDAKWVALAPDKAGFSTKFPAQPKLATSTTVSNGSNVPTSIWTSDGATATYYVKVLNYPAGTLTAAKPSDIYDSGVDSMTRGDTGLVTISQGNNTVNGHLGRNFLMKSATGFLQGEMFLVGDNLYMAYVAYVVAAPAVTKAPPATKAPPKSSASPATPAPTAEPTPTAAPAPPASVETFLADFQLTA
jgi:hypothetical protein